MKRSIMPLAVLGICSLAASAFAPAAVAAQATPTAAGQGSAMQFDQMGAVKSWRAGGDNIVFVQDQTGQWYKAVLNETCMSLNTRNGVSFVTEVDPATNQKVSKVMVDRHICTVSSLTKSDAPPAKK